MRQVRGRGLATFRAADLGPGELYRLMTSAIVPRPIALVATRNENGTVNVAPYSFFMGVSSNPPVVAVSVTSSASTSKAMKDTLRNALREKSFVVNSSQVDFGADLNACSRDLDYNVSELDDTSLTADAENAIAQSAWQFHCSLHDTVQIGKMGEPGAATVIFGRIERIEVKDAVLKPEGDRRDGYLDFNVFKPLARLGGSLYSTLGEIFKMSRPKK